MNINSNRNLILISFAIIIVIHISGINVPLMENAAKYAQVSREILINDDWINLTIGGDAYDQKPPLLFWIGALFFSIFGVSDIIYKVTVILLSGLGIFATFKLGNLLYDRKTGIIAAIFWGTSLGYLYFHNDIHTDTLLATVVIFSVWQLAAFFQTKKWHHFVLGITGVGLAMLTKGPVGLFIPAVAIGLQLFHQKQFTEIFHIRWIFAALIIVVIISPALIGLLNQFGPEGIIFYFWTNNMGRITGSYAGVNSDPTFYIHNSLYVLAPWTIFAFTGLVLEIKNLVVSWKNKTTKPNVMILGAIVPYLIILSVAKAKNPHYMLAVVPFTAILSAKWAIMIFEVRQVNGLKKFVTIANKVVAVVLLLFPLVFPIYVFPENNLIYWILVVLIIVVAGYLFFSEANLKNQILLLIFAVTSTILTINVNLLPKMIGYDSSIEAAKYFNENAAPGAKLNIYEKEARLWSLFLYSKAPGKYLVTKDDMQKFLPNPGEWVYTGQKGLEELQEMKTDMTVVKIYPHKTLTRQSLKFLNPKTREQRMDKIYLIKLN